MAKDDPIEKLLSSLGEAKSDTLDGIDQRIAEKKAEIDQASAALRKDLAGLLAIRKVLAVFVHGPKVGKKKGEAPSAPKKEEGGGGGDEGEADARYEALRNKIHDLLSKRGPMGLAAISASVSFHHIKCKKALEHPWFEKTSDGYTVAVT